MANHNFTQLDNEVLDVYGPQIGLAGYAVYNALARFAQGSGYCWPAQDTLATLLDCTDNTIRKALKKLKEAGLIEVVHRFNDKGKTSNGYRLLPVTKNTGAAPTDGVAEPPTVPKQEAQFSRDCDGTAAIDVGDYEPYDPADDEPLTATSQGGEEVEMFRTDEDVLIAIADIRQRNQDYLIRLLEDDGEGWPTDDDYQVLETIVSTVRADDHIAA